MQYLLSLVILIFSGHIIWRIIKSKRGAVRWIYIELIYNCFIKFVMGFLGLPSVLNYVTDAFLMIIVLYYILEKRRGFERKIPGSLQIAALVYFGVTVISYVFNLYSPLLYIWGFRNNMRFLIFGIMCAVYLKVEDIYQMMDILYYYFLLNIVTVTYEFFFAGFVFRTGDLISGLYSEGTTIGGNGALNFFLCVMCAMTIVMYLNKQKTTKDLLIVIIGSFYMAALSELKVFFVEIVLIAVLAVLMCKKTTKLIFFMLAGAIGLIIGVNILYRMFPQYAGFFAWDSLAESLFSQDNYGSAQSMSRTGAVSYVWNNYLTTFPKKLFGYGFGNADYSRFSFLTSDFYRLHSKSVYQWFYGPFIMVETGIAGLVAYIYILVNFLKKGFFIKKKVGKKDSLVRISLVITIISFVLLFYNQSLKIESAGYLAYFIMVWPYIVKKNININTGES